MKILVVTPYFYPRKGGLENYALEIAVNLRNQGNEVLVVTSGKNIFRRSHDRFRGLEIIRLPILMKLSNTPVNPLWLFMISRLIRREQPDVINAHTPVPGIADMAARLSQDTAFVLTYHNDLIKEGVIGNTLATLFYKLVGNSTLRRSDAIIGTSQSYATNSKYLKPYANKRAIVAPGIDESHYNHKVSKNWLRRQYPHKKIVLFVGNLSRTHRHKGVDRLIKAMASVLADIPSAHLIIVGDGDSNGSYKAYAKLSNLEQFVTFTGFVPDNELPLYFAGAHLFVLPSTNKSEGFGMVLQEAMACGTPVIGTDIGGIPQAIGSNSLGMLIPPQNTPALARAIVNQLQNPPLDPDVKDIAKWSSQAVKTLEIFTTTIQAKKTANQNVR